MLQTFTVTYEDIPIAVLDKNRQEQYTISKISFEIESEVIPNLDVVGSYMYRPEEHLTINEIPMLLLQFRKANICKSLVFCVHFPYMMRNKNRRIKKCDCTFEFRDQPTTSKFYLHLNFRIYQYIKGNKETPIDIQIKILVQDFIWIEDIYQIFYNICDDSFDDVQEYSSKVMTYFIPFNETNIHNPEDTAKIKCNSLEISFTSHYDFQKSFTIRNCFHNTEQQSQIFSIPKSIEIFETFGVWLKRERKKRNIQQQELSNILHVSNSFVSKLESDEKQPSLEFIENLAMLWNINLDFLLLKAKILTPYVDTISQNPQKFLKWMYDIHK